MLPGRGKGLPGREIALRFKNIAYHICKGLHFILHRSLTRHLARQLLDALPDSSGQQIWWIGSWNCQSLLACQHRLA